jgi:hypothetical protein
MDTSIFELTGPLETLLADEARAAANDDGARGIAFYVRVLRLAAVGNDVGVETETGTDVGSTLRRCLDERQVSGPIGHAELSRLMQITTLDGVRGLEVGHPFRLRAIQLSLDVDRYLLDGVDPDDALVGFNI